MRSAKAEWYKSAGVIAVALAFVSFLVLSAPPSLHRVLGEVFDNNGLDAALTTPVWINLTLSNTTYRTSTTGPPTFENSYDINVMGIDNETIVIRSWNATHYGENVTNLSIAPGDTITNIYFLLQRGSEANVSIHSPDNHTAYYIPDTFNVTAIITMLGANGTFCNASIAFTNASVANVSTGENATHSLGNVSLGATVNTTWSAQAVAVGSVNITVDSSCASDGTLLEFANTKELYNITILPEQPSIDYSEFMDSPRTTNLSHVKNNNVNLSVILARDGIGFIAWNETLVLNNTINLSDAVEITEDFAYVNGSIAALNSSANITITTGKIAYPEIRKDGFGCADCSVLEVNPGINFTFSVAGFSNYTWAEANQSKLQNNGTTNMSVYLLLYTQFNNSGQWITDDVIVNDTATGTQRLVNTSAGAGNLIKLDALWNPLHYTTANLSYGPGTYRVVAEAVDLSGDQLMDKDGIGLNATYVFAYTGNAAPSIAGFASNASTATRVGGYVNWSATLTDDVNLSHYLFSFNDSGSFISDAAVAINGTSYVINITKAITATRGAYVCANLSINDSGGLTAASGLSCFTVANTPPSQVVLSHPLANASTINRTSNFNWTADANPDNDNVTYELLITRLSCNDISNDCFTDLVNVTSIEAANHTIAQELDADSAYNWTVRAYDGIEYGEWSSVRNLTISSYLSLRFTLGSIDFGALAIGESKNTTLDSPLPLSMENDGNVRLNLTIAANVSLWERSYAGLGTEYFQFMAGNTTEAGSFNWSASAAAWENISIAAQSLIASLNYTDAYDSAQIEIKITVPIDEPPGTKYAGVLIEGEQP
ncbi:TPA: hypothetical protein HA361_02555 [Candidatus Woesearchaeota archaeon]|nr:hypothetical protein [Candidatus Woesearchaeota archaeon]